jgi:hypothetical protein
MEKPHPAHVGLAQRAVIGDGAAIGSTRGARFCWISEREARESGLHRTRPSAFGVTVSQTCH